MSHTIKLDVVVPTFKRSGLMRKAVESLLEAPAPPGLQIEIFVVDNNSPDDTASVVRKLQASATRPLHYLLETKQGSSAARNAGIHAGTGELIGFIDDDEEIDRGWYTTVAREFADPLTQYIGGPHLPNWEIPAPDWLPPRYYSVIGAIPPKARGRYGPGHPGMLNGGNAVLRRTVFDRVGFFALHLGRSSKGLLSEEDAEFFRRLNAAGISGMYAPELIVFHYVPANRLTRGYHRRWTYWRGVSQGLLDREQPEPVPYLFGVPRYRLGRAVRSLVSFPARPFGQGGKGDAFSSELDVWDIVGFLYGKYLFRSEDHYAEGKALTGTPPA